MQISDIAADFLEATDQSEAARDAFLNARCSDDPALRERVASLLAADKKGSAAFGRTRMANAVGAAFERDASRASAHWIGRTLGTYRIESEIAQGGMGAVFRAVRADAEFKKQVAIKIVGDVAGRSNIQERFRAERQILASLEHPNIAHLIDGGTTEDGVPYLVMEYVDGEPITTYCASKKLDVAARLDLFRSVCGAVHFAHQRLVVHRDLKPNNIFVTRADEVKLLDFGIAKMLAPTTLTEGAATTPMTTMLAMTPAYASPEQIKNETITTASDVYALGVVLYELLTGQSPYKAKITQPLDLAKEICGTDPERPSTVVGRGTQTSADSAAPAMDTLNVKRLQRGLRGDLDNIVLMALRKDPARRYASAQQLAEDVKRYQNDQPVSARPDTMAYRAAKFFSRNRWAVTACAVAATGLVVATGVATHQASDAQRARGVAELHASEARELANDSLFEIHTLIQDLPGSEVARKRLIEKAVKQLERLEAQSGLVANTKANASTTASASADLGWGWFRLAELQGGFSARNIGDKAGAERNYPRAIAALTGALAAAPADSALAARVVLARRAYGVFLAIHGKADQSLTQFDEAIRIAEPLIDPSAQTQRLRLNLATTLIFRSQYGAGGKRELALRLNDGERARLLLAVLVTEAGDNVELRDDAEDALMTSMQRLASLETDRSGTSGHAQALIWSEQAVALAEQRLLKSPHNTRLAFNAAKAIGGLANIYFETSRPKQALPYAKRSLDLSKLVSEASPADNSAAISVLLRASVLAMAQVDANDDEGAKITTDDFALRWQKLPEATRNVGQAQAAFNFARIATIRLSARGSADSALPRATRSLMCLQAIDETKIVRAYATAHPEMMSSPEPGGDVLKDLLIDLERCNAVTKVPKI